MTDPEHQEPDHDGQRPVASLPASRRRTTKRDDEHDQGECERHQHELVAIPQRVEELAQAPPWLAARRASWW